MKPQNRRQVILACMLSHISQLHGAEEMRVGQLGTTTDGRGLKDWEVNQAELNEKDQYLIS